MMSFTLEPTPLLDTESVYCQATNSQIHPHHHRSFRLPVSWVVVHHSWRRDMKPLKSGHLQSTWCLSPQRLVGRRSRRRSQWFRCQGWGLNLQGFARPEPQTLTLKWCGNAGRRIFGFEASKAVWLKGTACFSSGVCQMVKDVTDWKYSKWNQYQSQKGSDPVPCKTLWTWMQAI